MARPYSPYVVADRWTAQHEQAYLALDKAAERCAANDFEQQCRAYRGPRKKFQYNPCQAVRDLVDMMGRLGRFTVTPEEAMGILFTHDVDVLRFGERTLTK